ncbi:MAG TPA: hypothetical protein VFQ06_04890 [Nitrospira sp.]|nr:hypothetical protein [Nitrospira sp.]
MITVNFAPAPTGTEVHLYRVHPDGTEHEVIGSPAILSAGMAVFFDNTAPFDVAIHYRAVVAEDIEVFDQFGRVVANSWGTADSGQVYTQTGGAAGDRVVDGVKASHVVDSVNVYRYNTISVGAPDMTLTVSSHINDSVITGAAAIAWLIVRRTDDSNYYGARLDYNTDDSVDLYIFKRVAGVQTVLAGPFEIATSFVAAQPFTVKVQIIGQELKAKAWDPALGGEPGDWMLEASDSALLTGNTASLASRLETGNLDGIVTFSYDNLFITTPGIEGSVDSNEITLTASPDGWLKNPIMPTVDIRIDNCEVHTPDCLNANQLVFFQALDTEEYESATGVFPIVGAARPIVVSQVRKDLTTTLTIVSRRLEDITAIRTLLGSGQVLTLSLPAIYGWGIETFGTDWVSVGTVSASRIATRDMRKPYRVWALPLIVVDPEVAYPSGQAGGNGVGVAGTTWGDLAGAGLTWGDLSATGNTWLDTAQGDNY